LLWWLWRWGFTYYFPELVSRYDPPISASHVARITGLRHQHLASLVYFCQGCLRSKPSIYTSVQLELQTQCLFCLLRWSHANFLLRLSLNHNPPDLCLEGNKDYKCESPCLVLAMISSCEN
jgi:hypothetical protein